MSEDLRSRIFLLAKVLIAAAWADGRITEEEKQCLKDLLFHLPNVGLEAGIQMTAQEWARLEMYMDTPIAADERDRLMAELHDAIRTPDERQIVINYLQQMAAADGAPTPEEQLIIDEVGQSTDEAKGGMFDKLSRFLGGTMKKRSTAVTSAPNRERYFDDFVKNKVYYEVCQRLEQQGKTLSLTDEQLRKMGLAGGLMARVIYVDQKVTDAEATAMSELIGRYWELDRETAVFVAQVAISSLDYSYDYYRMTREFGASTTGEERQKFMDVLFQIALADGFVTYEETEEIRLVAQSINLAHEDFIKAKIKIPRDKRAS